MSTAILLVAAAWTAYTGLPIHTPDPIPAVAPVSATPRPADATGQRAVTRRAPHHISGKASWYATGRSGLFAAACRPLRRVLGKGWRGRHVLVAYGRKAVELRLNDYCASTDKLIDLSDEVFRYFAPLSRGVLRVTVGW